MEYQSTYPNRKTRRSFMNAGKTAKARGHETVFEFGMRVKDSISNGKRLHDEHYDRVLKAQEESLIKLEESKRNFFKELGYNKKETDAAINKWYDTIFKEEK